MIRQLRIIVPLVEIEGGSFIDFEAIVQNFPSLRTLAVAFAFPIRAYIGNHNSHSWSKSAALQGMICHTVQAVPEHIALSWWGGEEATTELEDPNYRLWHFAFVPRSMVEGLATSFEPLRGSLCQAV
jgi:hypothetical protein